MIYALVPIFWIVPDMRLREMEIVQAVKLSKTRCKCRKCKTYGLHFVKTMDLDIGLKCQAINQGKIDIMVIFTTDGQLSASDNRERWQKNFFTVIAFYSEV